MKYFRREPLDLNAVSTSRGQVYLIPERCKGCKICIHLCPMQALRESARSNGRGYHLPEVAAGREEACVHCQFCSLVCPEFAIFSQEASS